MVRIRMQRMGRRHRPFYRINAIDIRTRRDGKVLENLGHYNPMDPNAETQVVLKEEQIKAWIEKGAMPSKTVMDMLGNRGLLGGAMKEQWEKDREITRTRNQCKAAVKRAKAAAAALEELAGSAEADITSDHNTAKKMVTMAELAVPGAKLDDANKAADAAEAALKSAQGAAAKAAPAEEEAPAEESAES